MQSGEWTFLVLLMLTSCRLLTCDPHISDQQQDPSDNEFITIARRVGDKIIDNQAIFLVWDYGGALIFDGLQQVTDTFMIDYTDVTFRYLDDFKTQPWAYGYKILYNIPIPLGNAIGDTLGLFPIAYLGRITSKSGRSHTDSSIVTDWKIVRYVQKRVLSWPERLNDDTNTISRDSGWTGEPIRNASFVWADDQYMGLILLARLAHVTRNLNLAKYVANQTLSFSRYLVDQGDGLYYHGYNAADQKNSCCKWGRANGWALLAHSEILSLLETLLETSSSTQLLQAYNVIKREFRRHSSTLLRYQSPCGRFRQVINESTTFLETSVTAMIVTSWARALRHGWLPENPYGAATQRAWEGLVFCIHRDGTVDGICMGTGIQTSVSDYNKRPTLYWLSGDGGLGVVLQAAVQMYKYTTWDATDSTGQ